MCLQTVLEVVETAVIAYFSRHHAPREIGDAVGEGVPEAVVLFGSCVWWRFDWVALFDEGIQIDHLEMTV